MLKYYSEMITNFGEKNAARVFAVECGVRAYPILDAEGLGLCAPMAAVVEDEEMIGQIIRAWCGFAAPKMVSLSEKSMIFKKEISMVEYELVAVLCKGASIRNRENLFYLNDIMTSRCVDGRAFTKLPVVFFIGGIPPELSDLLVGKIVFEKERNSGEKECRAEHTRHLLEQIGTYWPIIQDKLDVILRNDSQESIFLTACEEIALVLLNAEVKEDEEKRAIRMFEVYVNSLKNAWTIRNDYSEWIERLRDQILKEGKKLTASIDRTSTVKGKYWTFGDALIYDKKYYYITESMFMMACTPMGYYIGQCEMKHALAEAGILIGEGINRKYYSVKVPISTPEGLKVIERRMRIIRVWIDRPGELTWYEQIEMQQRGGEKRD